MPHSVTQSHRRSPSHACHTVKFLSRTRWWSVLRGHSVCKTQTLRGHIVPTRPAQPQHQLNCDGRSTATSMYTQRVSRLYVSKLGNLVPVASLACQPFFTPCCCPEHDHLSSVGRSMGQQLRVAPQGAGPRRGDDRVGIVRRLACRAVRSDR